MTTLVIGEVCFSSTGAGETAGVGVGLGFSGRVEEVDADGVGVEAAG